MILTDREIKIYLQRRLITIDPAPDEDIAYQSTVVDLTLDPTISIFKSIPTDGYPLNPDILILGWTKEYIDLSTGRRMKWLQSRRRSNGKTKPYREHPSGLIMPT